MQKKPFTLFFWLIILMLALQACNRIPISRPIPTDPSVPKQETVEPPAPETLPPAEQPPQTEEPVPTEVPSEPTQDPVEDINEDGQIAYIFGGNVWRYLVTPGISQQITTDGSTADYTNRYTNPQFSPDGRYLAYTKNGVSTVLDFLDNVTIDLSPYGEFFSWTGTGHQFFVELGDFECPPVDNLSEQTLINFDVVRYDLDVLTSPAPLANIGGGLKFLSAISPNGLYATVTNCGCYSECGSDTLWYLPTVSTISAPASLRIGNVDFSSDSLFMVVSNYQMFGYSQSPLYIANSDFSGLLSIYDEPNVAPTTSQWSPDMLWIGFTAISFTNDMEASDSRVILVHPDGSGQMVVEGNFANMADWAPDSSKLIYYQEVGSTYTFYIYDLAAMTKTMLPFTVDAYNTDIDWGVLLP
jgi:hypothetical protein